MTSPQPPAEPPTPSAAPVPLAAPVPSAAPVARPGPYGSAQPGPPPASASTSTNGLAISSLIVSIGGCFLLSCLGLGGLVGIAGAILGHVGRRQIRERDQEGDGLAIAGIIIGWIAAGIGLLIFSALGDLAFGP